MVLRRLYRWLRRVSESGRLLPQISRSISCRLTTRGDSRIRIVSSFRPIGESCSSVPPRVARSEAGSSRSEEHTSELQSLMRISYAVFCLKKKKNEKTKINKTNKLMKNIQQ